MSDSKKLTKKSAELLLFPRLPNSPGSDDIKGMLREYEDYLEETKTKADKALILSIVTETADGEPAFYINWFNAGLRITEIIAACEIMKIEALKLLHSIPEDL